MMTRPPDATRVMLVAVSFLALVGSWGQPLLNSHSHRQTQTAQTIQIFLEEGWHPLLPKLHFFGKPGYCVLEFPLYQSLVTGMVRLTSLSLETSGRLISWLAALLLAAGLANIVRQIQEDLPDNDRTGWPRPACMVLIMGTPLVFATSQWVSIEILNNAAGCWSFSFFLAYLKAPSKKKALLFFFSTAISLSMKPNVLFALWPLFLLAACRNKEEALPPIFMGVVATALAALWFFYGEKVNSLGSQGYKISSISSDLLLGGGILRAGNILKLGGRIVLYLVGPGTVILFVALTLSNSKDIAARWNSSKGWIGASVLSIACYLTVFFGANALHNYYQLPLIVPCFLILMLMVPWKTGGRASLLLAAALVINLGVSAKALMPQDKDWKNAIAFLKTRISLGPDQPEIVIVSNWPAAPPVLGYYLDRYGKGFTPGELASTTLAEPTPWVGVCDRTIDPGCAVRLQTEKVREKATFGRLEVFVGNKGT